MLNPLIQKPMKKLFYFFMLFGWLLISFRPAEAQTSVTLHENWNIALTTPGEVCQDLQVMNGHVYSLIYRGYWVNFDHYRVEKRDANGTVVASINKDDVKNDINMLCYDNKILLTSIINGADVTGVKLYDSNLGLLKDTSWAAPWTNSGQIRTKLFYYNNNILLIRSAYDFSSSSQKMKIDKLDPMNLSELNSIVIDSANFYSTVTSYMGDNYRFFNEYGDCYYLNVIKQESPEILQKIKLNGNLQIINIEPPSTAEVNIKMLNYASSIYYLGANINSGDLQLTKKDTANFLNNWQVNLPWLVPSFSRNQNILTTGSVFLSAPGDGTIQKINPVNGGILCGVTVISIPQTADKSHHFYKIHCGQDYPFMVVGPTSTNPSEPFKIYLLDPSSLNTWSIKTIAGINPDYKIKEAGDKIYVIGNKIIELSTVVWPSFKIIAGYSGQDVTNGSSIINLSTPAPPEVIFNANADSFWVKNINGTAKSVKCKKIVINQVNGSSNFFSWDITYGPTAYVSNSISIPSDSSFKSFSSHYLWNNLTGSTKIRYVFFDSLNANDSVWYDLTYDITVGLPENLEDEIKIFPNPAQDQLYIQGVNQADLTVYNLMGEIILKSQTKQLDVSSLKPGIYYLKIENDNKTTIVRKFLKQ